MKKVLFAIFAHPDDEAFGPSGTLLLETRAGTELHLITLTAGENGTNPDNHENLKDIRLQEWRKSGELMGASSMHHLGLEDGKLCNQDFQGIVSKLEEIITSTTASINEPYEIELMSNDLNGITGHIDHIVAARAACQVFYSLKNSNLAMSRIRLICVPREHFPALNTSFVFRERGRLSNEIDEVIDAREVYDQVQQIIRCHHTQRSDGEAHLERLGELVAVNHFIVYR